MDIYMHLKLSYRIHIFHAWTFDNFEMKPYVHNFHALNPEIALTAQVLSSTRKKIQIGHALLSTKKNTES